jgi:hypothetical protein
MWFTAQEGLTSGRQEEAGRRNHPHPTSPIKGEGGCFLGGEGKGKSQVWLWESKTWKITCQATGR